MAGYIVYLPHTPFPIHILLCLLLSPSPPPTSPVFPPLLFLLSLDAPPGKVIKLDAIYEIASDTPFLGGGSKNMKIIFLLICTLIPDKSFSDLLYVHMQLAITEF